MSRPLILPSGVLAYAVGVALALAEGPIDWSRQAIGLTLTMLANLAAHYADEYADADTDALARHTGVSGGSGAIAAGYANRPLALRAAVTVSGITLLGGAWATLSGAIPCAAGIILLLGLLGGWAYSMPPIALERRGWGELANALLGGLLMPPWPTLVPTAPRRCASTPNSRRSSPLPSSALSACIGPTATPMRRSANIRLPLSTARKCAGGGGLALPWLTACRWHLPAGCCPSPSPSLASSPCRLVSTPPFVSLTLTHLLPAQRQ